MRCDKCGGPIGNKIIRVNGVTYCENCARELKIDEAFRSSNSLFNQAFPILGDLTNAIMSSGSELEFSNTRVKCPRCGTSLRDVETSGLLGCLDCYNTFGDLIEKDLLKRQGSSEYKGRKPGEHSEHKFDVNTAIDTQAENKAGPQATASDEEAPTVVEKKIPEHPEEKDILKKLANADLGMVPDETLEEAMNKAVAAEDYILAARLRDELKSRKENS